MADVGTTASPGWLERWTLCGPPWRRRCFAVAWLVAGGLALAGLLRAAVADPLWLAALPFDLMIAQLAINPLARECGVFRYHSPMLKSSLRSAARHEIHAGTLFDYLMRLRWSERGAAARRKVACWYLMGLLELADAVERGELSPGLRIEGTTHFLKPSTATRLGFVLGPAGWRLSLNLAANYAEVLALHSFARGGLSFPDLSAVRTATITGAELLARRDAMRQLVVSLDRATPRLTTLSRPLHGISAPAA